MNIGAYMVSCPARDRLREATLASLRSSDWGEEPVVCFEHPAWELPLQRHTALVRTVLEVARKGRRDAILLLEDDIVFNRHLRSNIESWQPFRSCGTGRHFYASLFNPGVVFTKQDSALRYGEAELDTVLGAQALLISIETAHFLATAWGACPARHADIRMTRLAALVCPVLFHMPSLVQHVGIESLWNGPFLSAADFDIDWRT